MTILHCAAPFIHCMIHPMEGASFLCNFLYGINDKKDRVDLWHNLKGTADNSYDRWVVMGE